MQTKESHKMIYSEERLCNVQHVQEEIPHIGCSLRSNKQMVVEFRIKIIMAANTFRNNVNTFAFDGKISWESIVDQFP